MYQQVKTNLKEFKMGKINKKIKKTLNMYPAVRNQPHYPSGYDGVSVPKRRRQLEEFISEDGTFLPKSVLHADLDLGLLDFVKDRLVFSIDGKAISFVDQILTLQRWGEFTETWSFTDKDLNPEIPFLVAVRDPAVQYGSNPALTYTIPDRRTFHYAKVPTWDGQRKGVDIYKIPQPVPVDIIYDLKIVCNRMRELNRFNKIMMQTFTSRQAYTFVKGHYIPIILNSLSDESQISDNEKRKFYTQNYQLQLQGFLIDEEEFEVTPAVTRKLLMFEVDTKTRKRPLSPTKDNPRSIFSETFTVSSGLTTLSVPFEFDANVEVIETTNNSSYTVGIVIDGIADLVSDEFTTYYISKGQILRFVLTPIDPTQPQTITLQTKFI